MILKYKQLVSHILSALILLKSTNVFAGKDKEVEELNHFFASSSSKGLIQLTSDLEKPQNTTRLTRKYRQNNLKTTIARLEDHSVDNSESQTTTTSTSSSYNTVLQEISAFNTNNFLSTFSPRIEAEKKGANFFGLALFYSKRSTTSHAKSKDIEKCLSYCRKALKIKEFRTSVNGHALIATLSNTSEGLLFLQSVGCLPRIPVQTLPIQTSLSPYPVGRPIPVELPYYHPLNTSTGLPTIQASTNPSQNRISLPPSQIPFIPPSAISGVPHMATNNLEQFFQGASISSSPSFYQTPMPTPLFFPPTSEFTCVPVNHSTSSSSTSYNSQKEQQDLHDINAELYQSQEKQLQELFQKLEQLKKNFQILNSLR